MWVPLRTHARIHARWLPCALLGSKCADNTATRTRVPPRACALARGHCSNCTPSSSIPAPSPSLGAVWASWFLGGRGLSGKNRTAGRRRGSRPLVSPDFEDHDHFAKFIASVLQRRFGSDFLSPCSIVVEICGVKKDRMNICTSSLFTNSFRRFKNIKIPSPTSQFATEISKMGSAWTPDKSNPQRIKETITVED